MLKPGTLMANISLNTGISLPKTSNPFPSWGRFLLVMPFSRIFFPAKFLKLLFYFQSVFSFSSFQVLIAPTPTSNRAAVSNNIFPMTLLHREFLSGHTQDNTSLIIKNRHYGVCSNKGEVILPHIN